MTEKKCTVCSNIDKGMCGFCGKTFLADKEKRQGLCDRCYMLRREIKRGDRKGMGGLAMNKKGSWHEGKVNTNKKHIYIYYGDDAILVCSIQPDKNINTSVVEFVIGEDQ